MNNHSKHIKLSGSSITFYAICYVLTAFAALACLIPFILLLSGSVTSQEWITFHGYSILPHEITMEAYNYIFKAPGRVFRAYGVSIFITVVGTVLSLLITTMTANVLARKSLRYRNILSFYFYLTTLFNGGMVCTYIYFIRYLHLKDSILALILPGLLNVFNLLIMRSFMNEIPLELIEAAKIDGASEFGIYIRVVLPLMKSAMATIGLFTALNYWNDWYNAMLFISDEKKYPLQYMLYSLQQRVQAMQSLAGEVGISMADFPTSSIKLAMSVVAIGPIVMVYPFVQKYFVAGIMIGSVKG